MDIGGAALVGINDDLVGQFDDGAIGFFFFGFFFFAGLVDSARALVGGQFLDEYIDVGFESVGMLDTGQDLVAEANVDGDFAIGFDRAQGIGPLNVERIVDDDDEVRSAALDGDGTNLAQKLDTKALAQIFRDRLLGGESVEWDAVEVGDGLFHVGAGDADFLNEKSRRIGRGRLGRG